MAKIHIFGACSGTEPMPGMHHTSLAVETNGVFYFFDAGETCSYTASVSGVDLTATRAVFISHTHMDHVGGLGNLCWNIRKLSGGKRTEPDGGDLDIYLPNIGTFDGMMQILRNTESGYACTYRTRGHRVRGGEVFTDRRIAVTAFPTRHLPVGEDGEAQSFSYRIEIEGKRIVFSGDVGGVDDLDAPVGEGADWLLMETGHHMPADICRYVNDRPISNLVFVHHGLYLIRQREQALEDMKICRKNVFVAEDGSVYSV